MDEDGQSNKGADAPAEAVAVVEATPGPAKEVAIKKLEEAGWQKSTAIDYEALKELAITSSDNYEGSSARYEYDWDGDYGDVGPVVEALEVELFGGDNKLVKGDYYNNIDFDVKVSGPEDVKRLYKFEDANLHPVVLENIIKMGYSTPTAIQQYAIPAILQGSEMVAVSQTGSGKTAAYLIPVISKLMGKVKKLGGPKPTPALPTAVRAEPLVVIVVPTRELAIQIYKEACRLSYRSMMRPCVNYGGFPSKAANEELRKGCDILIATPGRLCSMIDDPSLASFARLKYTIIDEADELVNPDWDEDMRKIMRGGDVNQGHDHLFLMFSATFPKEARKLAREYMTDEYLKIQVGRIGSSHKNVIQNVVFADEHQKNNALLDLLIASPAQRTMIFCSSKPGVDRVDDFLYSHGLPVTSIHSDRHQREREDSMSAFASGKAPILVTTGVSARGWDIAGVAHVINYDLPSDMYGGIEEYVHRIGRTGRIGNRGLATSFYNERNEDIAQALVNILLECECTVPEFLEGYIPEDRVPQFNDNSDDEEAEDGDAENGADNYIVDPPEEAPFVPDAGFESASATGVEVETW